MKKILLATHVSFAEGILDTLQFILGEQKNVDAICAYTEEVPDMAAVVKDYMGKLKTNEEIIVVTDIYGGSVNNCFMEYIERPGFYLITGMNLPLLIELVTNMEMDTEKQIKTAIENSGAAVDCKELYRKIQQKTTESDSEEGI